MSRLAKRIGIACIWIGVGSFQSEASMFLRMTDLISELISISGNEGTGLGICEPFTLI
jgi:hypothetical protein